MPASPFRIALAIITAPRQAFEEIIERKLLVQGLVVTVIVGLVQALTLYFSFHTNKVGSLFDLAFNNPVSAVGMVLIVSYVANYLAKMMGGDGGYADTAAVVSWASVITLLVFIFTLRIMVQPNLFLLPIVLQAWLVVVVGVGMQQAHSIKIWRGVVAYLTGLMAFAAAVHLVGRNMPGVVIAYLPIASEAANLPLRLLPHVWITTLGLILGGINLMKIRGVSEPQLKKAAAIIGSIAVVTAAALTLIVLRIDPAMGIIRAHNNYEDAHYQAAIAGYSRTLRMFPADQYAAVYRAHAYYSSGDYAEAQRLYGKMLKSGAPVLVYHAHLGMGAVRLAEGDLKAAEQEFQKAAKTIGGEADVWLAVTYTLQGQLKKAIASAKKSIKQGRSVISYVVLADILASEGKIKDAEENIKKAVGIDAKLEERFGLQPEGWIGATAKLTREYLKFPLLRPMTGSP